MSDVILPIGVDNIADADEVLVQVFVAGDAYNGYPEGMFYADDNEILLAPNGQDIAFSSDSGATWEQRASIPQLPRLWDEQQTPGLPVPFNRWFSGKIQKLNNSWFIMRFYPFEDFSDGWGFQGDVIRSQNSAVSWEQMLTGVYDSGEDKNYVCTYYNYSAMIIDSNGKLVISSRDVGGFSDESPIYRWHNPETDINLTEGILWTDYSEITTGFGEVNGYYVKTSRGRPPGGDDNGDIWWADINNPTSSGTFINWDDVSSARDEDMDWLNFLGTRDNPRRNGVPWISPFDGDTNIYVQRQLNIPVFDNTTDFDAISPPVSVQPPVITKTWPSTIYYVRGGRYKQQAASGAKYRLVAIASDLTTLYVRDYAEFADASPVYETSFSLPTPVLDISSPDTFYTNQNLHLMNANGCHWYLAYLDSGRRLQLVKLDSCYEEEPGPDPDPDPGPGPGEEEKGGPTERQALVWNFEEDNYTWMNASVIVSGALSATRCMKFGFDPGWLVRWQDLTDRAVTWEDLQNGVDPWGQLKSDNPTQWDSFYEAGGEQNFYWLSDDGVWQADQRIDTSGVKKYFVERNAVDFDDVVPQWTSYNYKHVRQLFPLLESPSDSVSPNTYTFNIGWANNLMDAPDYEGEVTVNLLKTSLSGKHKIDVRSTGRYMGMVWDFTYTNEIHMTGVDIDMEEAHGR